jgi:hypothetical protein
VEAAVEDGPGVRELPLEHVGVGVVQPHRLDQSAGSETRSDQADQAARVYDNLRAEGD